MVYYLFSGRIVLEVYIISRMIVFFNELNNIDINHEVIYYCGVTGCKLKIKLIRHFLNFKILINNFIKINKYFFGIL